MIANFSQKKSCSGYRNVVPEGKCIRNRRFDLFDCYAKQELKNCGKCQNFLCSTLKEWASNEPPKEYKSLLTGTNEKEKNLL